MKFTFGLLLALTLTGAAIADTHEESDLEIQHMTDRGWHHLGCVNQSNSIGSCRRIAAQRGYHRSRVQQDYICNPRVFLSCYGRIDRNMEEEVENRSSCWNYVKPATCLSHAECTWTSSCVPK